MHAENRKQERALQLAVEKGALRPKDIAALGLEPSHLQRLYEQGKLLRTSRGIYSHPDAPLHEFQDLVEVALRAPRGVICLLSALAFHGIGTQMPYQVWLALPPHTHPPRLEELALRTVQMTDTISGVEQHQVGGIMVPIFSPARTVVDCFKFRNKIGLDIALEALKDGWRKRKLTMAELYTYGKLCRVSNIMQPYLESLTV